MPRSLTALQLGFWDGSTGRLQALCSSSESCEGGLGNSACRELQETPRCAPEESLFYSARKLSLIAEDPLGLGLMLTVYGFSSVEFTICIKKVFVSGSSASYDFFGDATMFCLCGAEAEPACVSQARGAAVPVGRGPSRSVWRVPEAWRLLPSPPSEFPAPE